MPKHVPANGATLATAVRAAGMSEREACRAAGLSTSAFRQVIVADGIHPSTPIGNVHALITTAGITWSELLDHDQPLPDLPPTHLPDETRLTILARILTTARHGTLIEHLCIVFGYTLDQLEDDLATLAPRFAALGLTLGYPNNSAVTLSRGADPDTTQAIDALARLDAADRPITRSAASVLHRAYTGTLSEQRATRQDRIDMAALTNRGALTPGHGPVLSADAAYSLMLDEDPTATT